MNSLKLSRYDSEQNSDNRSALIYSGTCVKYGHFGTNQIDYQVFQVSLCTKGLHWDLN